MKVITLIGLGLAALIAVVIFAPMLLLWCLNVLIVRPCGGASLAYTVGGTPWWAALVLASVFGGSSARSSRRS